MHTSTFLGNPVGCAMALAQIEEIRRRNLVQCSADLGGSLRSVLSELRPASAELRLETRGLGLLAGLELSRRDGSPATDEALRTIKSMLHRGFILLPEGEDANVISFAPPLIITKAQIRATANALQGALMDV